MERLKDKVAIVTGSGNGIGKAVAVMFAKEGAKVAVTCRGEESGLAVVNEIKKIGGEAEYFKLDVSKEKNCRYVVDEVVSKWGSIDILVNNAGILGPDKPTHEFTEEEWDSVFNIDVKGVLFMTKYAIPYMKNSGKGSIINMSSIWGLVGSRETAAYHAAKGAVLIMTKKDAVTYAEYNIRVNSIHPGTIMVPLVEKILEYAPDYLEKEKLVYPMKKCGEPDDVAYAAVFLASDEAKFITGTQLVVDGGYTAQ